MSSNANLTISVKISQEDLKSLTTQGFSLCLAKGVSVDGDHNNGNVVFSTIHSDQLGPNVQFTWMESYKAFETMSFEDGAKVRVDTDTYPIEPGQTIAFDEYGSGTISGSPDATKPITMENGWKDHACVGIQALDTKTNKFSTIYISTPVSKPSTATITPVRKYQIFFDLTLKTATMFSKMTTTACDLDLTGKSAVRVEYADKKWTVGGVE